VLYLSLEWLERVDAKRLIARLANSSGILDAYSLVRRVVTRSDVAIMVYHRVCPNPEVRYTDSISPETFERHLAYLSKNYKIVSLTDLVDYVQSRKSPQDRIAAITFDDGYRDSYVYAYPILKRFHAPATFFLTTGYIGGETPFWWDQVSYLIQRTLTRRLDLGTLGRYRLTSEGSRSLASYMVIQKLKTVPDSDRNAEINKLWALCGQEDAARLGEGLVLSWKDVQEMDRYGMSFGAHSVSHGILTRMRLELARNEIVESKRQLEDRLGRSVTCFAYPNGDYSAELVQFVRTVGFKCAVSVLPCTPVSRRDDIYSLPRIPVCEDFDKFKGMLCGLWGDYVRLKGAL
jgi:peptidoglycan/xylan/chitin deacetylase (PgdA/CDA1 family)